MIKKLLLSGLFLTFTAMSSLAEETTVMKIATIDGKDFTVSLVEGMQAAIWTNSQEAESPLNFFIYTGVPQYEDNGRPMETETENSPCKIFLDTPVPTLNDITLSVVDISSVGETGIASIHADILKGIIGISGVGSPVKILIVNSNGLTVVDKVIMSDTSFDLTSFGPGVYMVNIDGSTFKFLVP